MFPIRLNDVFPNWFSGGGIFDVLQSFPVPWKDVHISEALDLEYHGNLSGDKLVSPLVLKIKVGETLTEMEKTLLATTIVAICGVNWNKQWETLSFEYNPIENYSMVEEMTNDRTVDQYGKTRTRTDNLQHTKTGTEQDSPNVTETRTDNLQHAKTGTEQNAPNVTETRTDNLQHAKTGTEQNAPNVTETKTPNLTTTDNNSVYGFNSNEGVPYDAGTTQETGTDTTTRTGTETRTYNTTDADTGTTSTERTGTETRTYNTTDADTGTSATERTGTETRTYNTTDADTGTQTDNDGGSDTRTRNYTLTRSGNIGVTTSQQMIESERNLWIWNFFRNVVFPDVDRVLTIQIY